MEDFTTVTSKKDSKKKYQKKIPSSQGSDASARGGYRGDLKKQQYREDEEMKEPSIATPVTVKIEGSNSNQMNQGPTTYPPINQKRDRSDSH